MNSERDSPWRRPEAVRGFVQAPPNETLLRFAASELAARGGAAWALDLGCGAARNAVPLAQAGWNVLGIDNSSPMIHAAAERVAGTALQGRVHLALATMADVPVRDRSCDLVVAHGIWNLARTSAEFRTAVREAARAARPGAGLFLFTFSRHTLAPDARPVHGERWVFTQFSGTPQCFLTDEEVVRELAAAGFSPDAAVPLTEHNRPAQATLMAATGPVIYEGAFRRAS